jgi:hypothetical protein
MPQDASKKDLQYITKLNGQEDWAQWIKQIKNYLMMSPQGFINLLEFQPTEPVEANGEELADFNKRLHEWKVLRSQAFATVDETCGTKASGILATSKAKGHSLITLFDELQAVFKGKGSGRFAILVKELRTHSLSDCKDVAEYGAKLIKIMDDLLLIDRTAKVAESIQVQTFLDGLGPSFQSFKDTFSMQHDVIAPEGKEGVTLSTCMVAAEDFESSHKSAELQANFSG